MPVRATGVSPLGICWLRPPAFIRSDGSVQIRYGTFMSETRTAKELGRHGAQVRVAAGVERGGIGIFPKEQQAEIASECGKTGDAPTEILAREIAR
jgi:hypothetical protein